jgi:23S rRNA (adenine2503-C2)-methyltransferase
MKSEESSNQRSLHLIYDLSFEELEVILSSWEEPRFRITQVWQGLYRSLWREADRFTNLPVSLRQKLAGNFLFSHLKPGPVTASQDGKTVKTLFYLPDQRSIEAVLMQYKRRRTLCISTQAGCAMGCVFCATGQMGFMRNLSSGEIVEQVLYYARQLVEKGERVTNIVIMGMGEPFHNYDATMEAIDRLNHSEGFNFGARRFTISTVGLVPAIRRFASENRQVNLAISLHSVDDNLRSSLLPVNDKYPLDSLFQACHEYVEKTNRRITFEWALIKDVNDTPQQAQMLAERAQIFRRNGAMLCHVNIIRLNPTTGYAGEATSRERALEFKTILENRGIPCTIRLRRGVEIQAGCGQLATQNHQG